MIVEATLRSLVLFDVADFIQIEEIGKMLGGSGEKQVRALSRSAPESVRFEQPPVIERYPEGRIRYYNYGVVSVETDAPFSGTWTELVERSSRWITHGDVEKRALDLLRPRLDRAGNALVKPYQQWLSEDYYVVLVYGIPCTATELLEKCGMQIAQIVRGEAMPLADDERDDVLKARISYYPNDLAVIGWSAAVVCDTPAGAAPTVQLLEYANTQLLEYRRYDELLTRVLGDVYKQLDEGTGFWARWRMARRSANLNTIRLDVIELTERTDNAIKFLSDMFYARLYKLASSRVGVLDYRNLVDEKLRTAGELYQFMVDQFQQARAFVLELMVVVILVIELIFLFRGK
jgi:hypothetical protein